MKNTFLNKKLAKIIFFLNLKKIQIKKEIKMNP